MAHFAELDSNNIVQQVIVVGNKDILDDQGNESEEVGKQLCTDLLGGIWIQSSYNRTFRKNHASIDDTYDDTRDAFIAPKPYPSWLLDEETCWWEAPIPYPDGLLEGETAVWDEETINWVLVTLEE